MLSFMRCVGDVCTGISICLCLTHPQSLVYTSVQKRVTESLRYFFAVHVLIKGRWSFPYLVSILFSLFKRNIVCIKNSGVEHDLIV